MRVKHVAFAEADNRGILNGQHKLSEISRAMVCKRLVDLGSYINFSSGLRKRTGVGCYPLGTGLFYAGLKGWFYE